MCFGEKNQILSHGYLFPESKDQLPVENNPLYEDVLKILHEGDYDGDKSQEEMVSYASDCCIVSRLEYLIINYKSLSFFDQL